MRTINKITLMLMAIVLVLSSCKEKDEPAPALSLSPSSISASADKSTQTLNIVSNTNWAITEVPSWIEVSPSSGKNDATVQVTFRENSNTEERSAFLLVSTLDGSIEKTVIVKQSGKEVKLSVDITSINLSSEANSSQAINITSNSSWTISGIPDWLQVSSLSGNGNSSIVITTRSANESANIRTANIVVSAEGESQTIAVQQEAAFTSSKATPSNITTLYYAVVFNLEYSSEVALTKMLLLSDYEYKHKTEAEIIAAIEKEESQIPEDETIFTRVIDEKTNYHILTLSYDKKGQRGDLVDVMFESPAYLSGTDDAWCSFEDATYNESLFWFTVMKKGRCTNYDLIYGANIKPSLLNGPLMAYEINYYINNKKKNWLSESWDLQIETNYPNDHTFSCSYSALYQYGGLIATAWGIFSDGTRSSDINSISSDTYADDVKSLNNKKSTSSDVEMLRKQKGWIKFSSKDLKK